MQRVSLLSARTSRAWVAAACAVLVFSVGLRVAAADPAGAPPDKAGASSEGPATQQASDEERPATEPKLQLQDEGPALRRADAGRRVQMRLRATEETEERPFWKSWVFWTVTGVLVAGAVGMIVYTASGTGTSLAPCPADVQVSLGCFGTGR